MSEELAERIAQAIEDAAGEYRRDYKPSECEDADQGWCHHDAALTAYSFAARIARHTPTPAAPDDTTEVGADHA